MSSSSPPRRTPSLLLNMPSMRSVTETTDHVEGAEDQRDEGDRPPPQLASAGRLPSTSRAPSTTMPWIALVPDISGGAGCGHF